MQSLDSTEGSPAESPRDSFRDFYEKAVTEARYFVTPDYKACPPGCSVNVVVNPASLEEVGRRMICDDSTINAVVTQANQAQKDWSGVDTKTRAAYLHAIADSIEKTDPQQTSVLLTQEMGKPYPESVGEIANCGAVFRYYAELARDDGGKIAGTTQTGTHQYAVYEPYGVSVHILPFNFPILLLCWTVAASLAAGNACIIKPAEATTLSTLDFMRHFQGLPPALVSCLPGSAATAQHLVHSRDTHAVAFTGSVDAAKSVAAACASQLKPCVIEAGGNDAMIISASAPLDVAIAGSVTAAFHLSGQICTSSERFFVVDEIYDRFIEGFIKATKALRIGDGLQQSEIGPLVSEAALHRVQELVSQSVAVGARIVCGGRRPPLLSTGWFYEPTILADITIDMPTMQAECFGPLASVCRVDDFDQALALANQSNFGLGASVFTTDLNEAMSAASELKSGMVWVNNPLIDNDALPFGGWKASGVGRELGRAGLDAFRQSRMVIIDHDPVVQEWWYPYSDDWFFSGGGRKLF